MGCGVFVANSLVDVYRGIKALNHRGKDAAGVARLYKRNDGLTIDGIRWLGDVEAFALSDLRSILFSERNINGGIFVGHVRYKTHGSSDPESILIDSHPQLIGGKMVKRRRHLITRDAQTAIVHNGQVDLKGKIEIPKDFETEIDSLALLLYYLKNGSENVLRDIPGAYVAAILDTSKSFVTIIRDRFGIRPCWIGRDIDNKYVVSSEDQAITAIGGFPIRELNPGEEIHIGDRFESIQVVSPNLHYCFFEDHYLSSERAKGVWNIRYNLGVELAREYTRQLVADRLRRDDLNLNPKLLSEVISSERLGPDVIHRVLEEIFSGKKVIVTYVPHCPEPMVEGFSQLTELPQRQILYKKRYIRSFMEPTQEGRYESISTNLFLSDNLGDLRGTIVIVIDDSIVRGTVSKYAIELIRSKNPEEVHFLSATPQIGGRRRDGSLIGCEYGVDMPPEDNFATVKYGKIPQIQQGIGADILVYLSPERMLRASDKQLSELCTYCIGGPHPFGLY